MRTYGTINCPDCGVPFVKTSPNKKRCAPCADAKQGVTRSGYKPRQCVMCGSTYKPTGTHQKACAACADDYRAANNREHLARLREARGAIQLGTILQCADCGDDFAYTAGPQRRCAACQRRREVTKIREWLEAHPDKADRYKANARDNYDFSGNRQAALDRDGHTCKRCGATDDLHVHHIDGRGTTIDRAERNNSLDNLVTLCRGCHTTVHHLERRGEVVSF